MPSKPSLYSKKQQKLVWLGSLFPWWGLGYFLTPKLLPLAYGSFLLWAATAGFIWGRKAPFLVVGIFLVGSASLSWEVLSTEPWRWVFDDTGLWSLLVFLSSLSSSFWASLQDAKERVRDLERGFLNTARWSIWGRLTVGVGHELRNQIAIVTGYLDQMKEDGQLSPIYQRKLERSLLANSRMLKILAQLRSLTRDCLQEPLQPLTVADVVQEALEFMQHPLEYRGISVNWTAEAGLPQAMAHPVLLETLLVDLLLDSLDRFKTQTAADGKFITLNIKSQNEGICLHYQDNCQAAVLWDDAGQLLAQQLTQHFGGSMVQTRNRAQGSEVFLHLKSVQPTVATKNQDAWLAS